MIVRKSIPSDLEQIYSIEVQAFPTSAWTVDMISSELIESFDRQTWVAVETENIIGYCMVRFGPDELHLINMAVKSNYQKRGVASLLINHFLKDISPKTSVFLEVKQSNFPAINLYNKHNFVEIGIRKKYYSDGENAIVMLWVKD